VVETFAVGAFIYKHTPTAPEQLPLPDTVDDAGGVDPPPDPPPPLPELLELLEEVVAAVTVTEKVSVIVLKLFVLDLS